MQVQDLIAQLQRHDPRAKLAFTFPSGGDETGECYIERIPTIPGASLVEIRMNLGCDTVTAEECDSRVLNTKTEILQQVNRDFQRIIRSMGEVS